MSSSVLKEEENRNVSDVETTTSENAPDVDDSNPKNSNTPDQIQELRRILVQPEEVGDVLPTAVKQSSQKTDQLSEATLPIVEENIRQSVLRNPKVLAEALFPVIGPAIRKAISEALGSMVQSLNQTLEYSVSPKGLRWRLEALQTGKSFGEIVMLKTLLYRVEQVFLIHREAGLLLQHVAANPKDVQDADMVSAMLTAIEDFVHDSFKSSDDATLDSLKIKELSVWIESSPDAIIAGVIRGNPPLRLRETFSQAIEEIQFKYEENLENFKGDSSVFDEAHPILEECLKFQASEEAEKKQGFLKPSNILVGILGLLILVGGFFYIRDYWRWSGLLERFEKENGIVVTEAERGWFTHSINGLKDPLANDPNKILSEYSYDEGDVEQTWKPYQDMSSEIVLMRAKKILQTPKNVQLKLENGVLSVAGDVSNNWFSNAKNLAIAIAGVDEFRLSDEGLQSLKNRIESEDILFVCNTTDLLENQKEKIENIRENLESLVANSDKLSIEIHGYASTSGSEEINDELSKERAEKIKVELINSSEKIKTLNASNSGRLKVIAEGAEQGNKDCKAKLKINLK